MVIPRKEGDYEIVSGYWCQMSYRLAGIQTMPVIVRQLDRDEAIISMVDTNLKRENISPMEKVQAPARAEYIERRIQNGLFPHFFCRWSVC